MATLKDISRHLGISVTQVSRALNDHYDVSQKTKERVHAAAKELGYAVNLRARSLVTGRTGMICLIRTGLLTLPDNMSVFEIITGLSLEFSKKELQFVLQMTPAEADPITAYKKAIASKSFDGFVIIEARAQDERVKLLESSKIPFVVHGRIHSRPKHAYFDIDNVNVARMQVHHLIERGHRRIALLNGPRGLAYSENRLKGYRVALQQAGIEYDKRIVSFSLMTENQGLTSTVRLFHGSTKRPTALICCNTLLAKGAYCALAALGLRIPQEVSVIAHDDVLSSVPASAFYPALTATRSPFNQSWTAMAAILREVIEERMGPQQQVVAEFEFVERASTDLAPKI